MPEKDYTNRFAFNQETPNILHQTTPKKSIFFTVIVTGLS